MARKTGVTRPQGGIVNEVAIWPRILQILFVIDGRIGLSRAEGFGLADVMDTLHDPNGLGQWLRLKVRVAQRGASESRGLNVYHPDYEDFRFTDTHNGFDIDAYDQIWFFGDKPNLMDGQVGVETDDDVRNGPTALSDAELKLLAEWMDRGGGVFATGDHTILGGCLSSRIPRVRTMRKWRYAQGVPANDGALRYETLQPPSHSLVESTEGDTALQPIELVYRGVAQPPLVGFARMPHPLMCSPWGPIDRFPDHMHEGEVFDDDEVELDLPLDIPGYARPEYPPTLPELIGTPTPGNLRPRPHVVAYGRTTHDQVVRPTEVEVLAARPDTVLKQPKRFGLVSAYDGEVAGIGRVVVDSTWHHWLGMNLKDIALENGTAWHKIQTYFRNVAIWLARPQKRRTMLVAGTWATLASAPPVEFRASHGPWRIGERVVSTLTRTLPSCMLDEFVGTFLDPPTRIALKTNGDSADDGSPAFMLPEQLVIRAIVGGIGEALLDLAEDHRTVRTARRPRPDPELIRRRALEGATRGHALLHKAAADAATTFGMLTAGLAKGGVTRGADLGMPVDTCRLRIVAETLQFPDPRDPELAGRHVTLTMRASLDGAVVASRVLRDLQLPSFEARGAIVALDCAIGEIAVRAGEFLTIELFAGDGAAQPPDAEAARFADTHEGDAPTWIGRYAPARMQAWRLWYRIEVGATASAAS